MNPKAHATGSVRPEQTRGHLRTVRDTHTGSRDQDPPDAHVDDVRTRRSVDRPRSPRARPGARPEGEPHRTRRRWPRAPPKAVREHRGAEALRRPTRDLGSRWRCARPLDPHDSEMLCPTAADTLWPLVPTTPGRRCLHRIPVTGLEEPGGCSLCCHRRRRPRHSAAPPSLPARWSAFGARPKPRSSRLHPASVREPDRMLFHRCSSARRLAKPTHPILRTDRADVAADSTSSPDPRFVAVSEPRSQLVPVPPRRSKLRPGGGRHEPKPALTVETKPREKPSSGARTPSDTVSPPCSCTTSDKTRGS
jgi:hypothetical protein